MTDPQPFWRRPMRIMDLALEDSHGSWVNHWTAEQVVEIAVRMNANVLNMMVVNEWGQAYWPSRHLPMQPELRGEDRFGAVAERARQAGLHVSGMWGPTAAPCQSQRHPDWAARRRDGTRIGWGEKESEKCFHICMNSPFEDQVNEVADQLFRDYPIELLALDFYYKNVCWCEFCRQRCLADTGFDISRERAPFGREHVHEQWQRARVAEQLARVSETVAAHGGVIVNSRIVPGVDILFSEPHTGDMLDLRDKGFMVRLNAADARATGKSHVICTPYAHHYFIGWSKPPAHMRQEFRVIGIHGSNPWPVMWDWEILRDPRGLEPLGAAFGEMKSIEHLMAEARPLRHVALVCSSNETTFEDDGHVHEHGDAVKGFYDALSRAHIPFEIVREDVLTAEGLRGYRVLVLPNVKALSDEQLDTVKGFVSDGGHLVATYETSLYTAEGWSRYEFGLEEVFGARYLCEHEAAWCYITPRGAHPLFAHLDSPTPGLGIPHGDLGRSMRRFEDGGGAADAAAIDEGAVIAWITKGRGAKTGAHLKVEAGEDTEVIATIHDTHKTYGTYFIKDIVPAIPGRDTGYPAVVINRLGNGTSIYFSGQPDRLFNRQGHPDYEQLLVNAVNWAAPQPPIRVEAPNTVEATYWQLESGGYLLHLLNHTYDAMFPSPASGRKVPASRDVFRAVTQVIPVHDVRIHLENSAVSATVLIGDGEVADDGAGMILDRLHEYAVIEIR